MHCQDPDATVLGGDVSLGGACKISAVNAEGVVVEVVLENDVTCGAGVCISAGARMCAMSVAGDHTSLHAGEVLQPQERKQGSLVFGGGSKAPAADSHARTGLLHDLAMVVLVGLLYPISMCLSTAASAVILGLLTDQRTGIWPPIVAFPGVMFATLVLQVRTMPAKACHPACVLKLDVCSCSGSRGSVIVVRSAAGHVFALKHYCQQDLADQQTCAGRLERLR